MNIGIIGTGSVGNALARGLKAAGHETVLGSRNPEMTDVDGIEVATQRAAAEYGDVVVLALPAGVVVDIASDLRDALADKPVIDATNEYPTPSAGQSVAERVGDAAPRAHVVKAFNTIGANRMTDPVVDGADATMFIAGSEADAVDIVETLARDLGFEPVVAGDLAAATHLENLARFWIHLSSNYGRDIAFRFLQEDATSQ